MLKVGLFPIGYNTININKVCSFFNNAQSVYQFTEATSILDLGNPDIDVYGYSDKKFESIINPHLNDYNFSVIITCAPIEGNYYTRTILDKIILITLYQSEEVVEKSKRTFEEYLIIAIAQELISFEFQRVTGKNWDDLFHKDTRGCIFDFVGIKEQKAAKLISCKICDSCRGKLSTSNLNNKILIAFEKVLLRIKKPSILKSTKKCILSPIISFIYGGIVIGAIINLFSSFITSTNQISDKQLFLLIAIASLIFLFPTVIYITDWIKYLRSRMRY